MNLEKAKKISIIAIPVIIIILLIVLYVSFTSKKTGNNINIDGGSKQPPLSNQQVQTQKAALIKLMPVKSRGFLIEYLKSLDKFVVTITDPPYEQNQQEAEAW